MSAGMRPDWSTDSMRDMLELGCTFEFTINPLMPNRQQASPKDFANRIRSVGAIHCIASTDLGQLDNAHPVEGFRMWLRILKTHGFSDGDIDVMARRKPCAVLGLGNTWSDICELGTVAHAAEGQDCHHYRRGKGARPRCDPGSGDRRRPYRPCRTRLWRHSILSPEKSARMAARQLLLQTDLRIAVEVEAMAKSAHEFGGGRIDALGQRSRGIGPGSDPDVESGSEGVRTVL